MGISCIYFSPYLWYSHLFALQNNFATSQGKLGNDHLYIPNFLLSKQSGITGRFPRVTPQVSGLWLRTVLTVEVINLIWSSRGFQAKTQLRGLKIRGHGPCFSSGDIKSQWEPGAVSMLGKYCKTQSSISTTKPFLIVYLAAMRITCSEGDMAVSESYLNRVWLLDKEKTGTEKCFRHLVFLGANNLQKRRYKYFSTLNNESIKDFLRWFHFSGWNLKWLLLCLFLFQYQFSISIRFMSTKSVNYSHILYLWVTQSSKKSLVVQKLMRLKCFPANILGIRSYVLFKLV